MRGVAILACGALAACKPPAADDYVARVGLDQRAAPSEPLVSPETEGAVWAPSAEDRRIIYGIPGKRPLMALACEPSDSGPMLAYIRYAPADPHAKAILALIGNGHVVRWKIDAVREGEAWLWRGSVPIDRPELEVLTGPREVEATVPGAGSVILNPSSRPGALIAQCRSLAERGQARQATPE